MNESESNDGGKRVGALERAFDIVERLSESGTMRISDVAADLEMATSTVHVHLKTLEELGYVVKTPDGYRLGLRFLRTGSIVRNRLGVYSVAKQEIDHLATTTGEVANLGVEERGQRVILYQAEGSEAVYDNALVGEYTNMHWTALGKAILAEMPETDVEHVVDRYGLPAATSETLVDREALIDELAQIRTDGFALEDEERRTGIRSIAVPLNVDETVVGAISLSGPKERFGNDRIEDDLLPALRDRMNVVEVKLAYD